MIFNMIKKGNAIIVNQNEKSSFSFKSAVYEIYNKDDNKILIANIPTLGDKILKLSQSEKYSLTISTNEGEYTFITRFQKYLKSSKDILVEFHILDEGRKTQKRNFFRFTCSIEIEFLSLDFFENKASTILYEGGYMKSNPGIIRDIGGGGIRFSSNHKININYPIEIKMILYSDNLKLRAEVKDIQSTESSKFKYQYRVSFLDISHSDREKIVEFIFIEQRKQRRILSKNSIAKRGDKNA